MPLPRVGVFTVCSVMSWIGSARVVGHSIQVIHTAWPSTGSIWTQIQSSEREIHCHVQLPTKTLSRWKSFQILIVTLRKKNTYNELVGWDHKSAYLGRGCFLFIPGNNHYLTVHVPVHFHICHFPATGQWQVPLAECYHFITVWTWNDLYNFTVNATYLFWIFCTTCFNHKGSLSGATTCVYNY
jgi:hypothetical protein